MTTETTTKRTRRGRYKPKRVDTRPCCRDGCDRPREPSSGGQYQYCSVQCRVVDRELRKAQRVCSAIGPSPATAELWASAVELSDALSRYLAVERELRAAAAEVGITDLHKLLSP